MAVNELRIQVSSEQKIVEHNIEALKAWNGATEFILKPILLLHVSKNIHVAARENKKTAVDILKSYNFFLRERKKQIGDLRAAFQKLQTSGEGDRTGRITLRVGVLNSGDSDGVVFPDANLRFADTSIALHRGKDRKIYGRQSPFV